MPRYKNTGLTPVPLTSGRVLDVGEVFDDDLDLSTEDSRIVEIPEAVSYGRQNVEALQAEADRRALQVAGTGKEGNVTKGDLVAALEADDVARDEAEQAAAAAAANHTEEGSA